jgi:hypothetical protein
VLTTGNMATSNHASSGLKNTLQDYEKLTINSPTMSFNGCDRANSL